MLFPFRRKKLPNYKTLKNFRLIPTWIFGGLGTFFLLAFYILDEFYKHVAILMLKPYLDACT